MPSADTARTAAALARQHPGSADALRDTLPWMRFLPEAEARLLAAELTEAAGASAMDSDPAAIAQLLIAWQHTAEVYADPELLAALTGGAISSEPEAASWQAFALRQFRRIRTDLIDALVGLDPPELGRPRPPVPSVGWISWHIARGQDRNLSEITGGTQLWLSEGWAARFGRPADPADTGLGHTTAQAAAFRSRDAALLTGYQEATHHLAEEYLRTSPDDGLARLTTSPTLDNTHSVEERLAGLIRDGFEHVGQIALLRPRP